LIQNSSPAVAEQPAMPASVADGLATMAEVRR